MRSRKMRASSFSLNKLDRAGEHIEHLRQLAKAWLGSDAYQLVSEADTQTGRTIVRAKISEPIPPAYALIAGDAAHSLRAALDNLAFSLAVAFTGDPLPPEIEKSSEFPILPLSVGTKSGQDTFHRVTKKGQPAQSSGLHKLRGIDPQAVNVIEGFQPYHRGAQFEIDPLWTIHELDRIDKHRRANVTTYALADSLGISGGPGGGYMSTLIRWDPPFNGPVEDGTEVTSFMIEGKNLQIHLSRIIAFAEPSVPTKGDVLGVLSNARDYLSDTVFPALDPFL
jgi:hypothetical protein